MTEPNSPIIAVQMVEFNPDAGNRRKGYTLSGVQSFRAGNAARGTPFQPSPIVPLPNPQQPVQVAGRSVPLVDFLTGQNPEVPGTYYVSQPGKPGLAVFRRIVAPSLEDLRRAVEVQAQQAAQAGRPGIPAPIVGVRAAAQRAFEAPIKSVQQILEEEANVTGAADAAPDPAAPEAAGYRAIMAEVSDRTKTTRRALEQLDAMKGTLSLVDLGDIVENGPPKLREWATAEITARAQAGV